MSILGEAAASYARRGWAVLPLESGNKRPIIQGGCTNASADEEQIRAFWEQLPESNIGIATGAKSNGLIVIDLDVHEDQDVDGMQTLREWEREHGELPETVTAITGSGGYHMLYTADVEVRNSANAELSTDIRGEGGYFVAPPSVHPNGDSYEWENPPGEYEVAQADANVMAFIAHAQPNHSSNGEYQKFELPDEINEGGRNDAMHRYASSLQAKGVSDDDMLLLVKARNKQVCKPPLPDSEVLAIVDNVAGRYEKGKKSELVKASAEPTTVQSASSSVVLDGNLQKTKNGALIPSVSNVMQLMKRAEAIDGHFYLDTFANRKTVILPVPWDSGEGERPVTDNDYTMLQVYMEQNGVSIATNQRIVQAVPAYCYMNQRNPVTDYLDTLQWDGQYRVHTLLACALGCEANSYNAEAMQLFMLGAVARAYRPGVKFDYMPVLYGAQGIGKSYFLRRLCPNPLWFDDNMGEMGKEAPNRLQGKWILEVAELLAMKKTKDVEAVKAFLTSTEDNWRQPYGRETVTRARRCVFAGTTNNAAFLTDPTGNRRFLPIECGLYQRSLDMFSNDYPLYIAQCWAETVALWKSGTASLVLSEESERYANALRGAYTEDDPRIGIVQQHLDERHGKDALSAETAFKVRACVPELMELLDIKSDNRRAINELHELMQTKVQGWYRYPKNGGKAKCGKNGAQRCYIPAEAFGLEYQKW